LLGIVAPAIGGVLAATLGAANAVALDAATYAASAIVIASIRGSFRVEEPTPQARRVVRRTLGDIREGLSFLWNQHVIRALTLLGFGVSFSGGAVTALLVAYGVEALGLDDHGVAIGVLFSVGAIGTLLGSLALPKLARLVPPPRITLWALPVDTLLLLTLAAAPSLESALPLYLAWSLVQMTIILNGITLRQRITPDRLQGRVNVTARMIAWGGTPFGAIAGGIIAEQASVRAAIATVAIGVAASAALAWLTPLRTSGLAATTSSNNA
jgi:hypothetical protein